MRLRRDSWYQASLHRRLQQGRLALAGWQRECVDQMLATPAAALGDCWPLHWSANSEILTGYVLTCPVATCPDIVHPWTHAYNCPARNGAGCKRGDNRQPSFGTRL